MANSSGFAETIARSPPLSGVIKPKPLASFHEVSEPFNPSMMPTRPMRVAVRYLFRTGSAYFNDFDIEGQGFTGHRMVGVDIGKLEADLGDDHMARALLGLQLGDHARLPAFGPGQMLDRHTLHGIGLARTVGFFRSDGDAERIAGVATFQGFFQAPDNAAVAMHVGVRFAATGVFDDVALVITDAVVKQDHLTLFDWHRVLCDGSGYAIIGKTGTDLFSFVSYQISRRKEFNKLKPNCCRKALASGATSSQPRAPRLARTASQKTN